MDTVTQQKPTCQACEAEVEPGEEWEGYSDYPLCPDRDACGERIFEAHMEAANPPAREAGAEHNEDPETGGRE